MLSALPQTLGNYRIIAKLGQGGMARALLAVRKGRGGFRKLFVIKQLRPDLLSEPAFLEMFLDEARLAALMSHPNVVQTHEISEADDECFISMDYLEGQSLARVLRRVTRPKVPLVVHIHIIAEVLAGLHYAHELVDFQGAPLRVVHRDVSPGNVFITYDGEVKLLDFGIAKAVGSTFQTQIGGLKGKLAYMAPEQAQAKKVDRRSDLFAAGVMLWEALAERRLVERGEVEAVTLNNRINANWEPISTVRPDAPPDLVSVCEKAMALDPADRFEDASQFRDALLACLGHWGVKPSREDVAKLVSEPFVEERKELAAKIAEKIEQGEQFAADEPLIRRARSTTGLPLFTYESPPAGDDDDLSVTTHRSQKRRRTPTVLVGLLVLALIAGGALAFALGRGGRTAANDSPANTGGSADASVVSVTPLPGEGSGATQGARTVKLFVSARPASASIELDGVALESNPYRGQVSVDDKVHQLVVSAARHEPQIRTVRFDRDQHIELDLAREGTAVGADARREARRRAERAERAEKERASALLKTRAEELARAEAAARAAAKARALAESKAKEKNGGRPRAGDSLKRPTGGEGRKIDETNPYK